MPKQNPSSKKNVITINVDEFHSNSNSDNGHKLSNGASPSSISANQESMFHNSSSELFMNNATPGADIQLAPDNYDAKSGKKILDIVS